MRIDPTSEVTNHQQQNPFLAQTAGFASPGKTASEISFKEYFRSNIQQIGLPTVTRQSESLIAGIYWRFLPTLRTPSKPEPTLKDNAN